MQTATIVEDDISSESLSSTLPFHQRLDWVLMVPFVFFSVHGVFSYQTGDAAVGGFLPGAVVTRERGVFVDFVMPAIAFGIVFWRMKSSWRSVVAFAAHFKLLTCLAFFAICSAAWSQNPSRSALFGFSYLLCTLFGYYLVIRFEPSEVMNLLTKTGILVCILGIVTVVLFPQHGLDSSGSRSAGAWEGIFAGRTAAAKVLVFMFSPTLIAWGSRSKRLHILTALLFLVMIIQARTVTAFFVLFVYLGFLVFLRLGRRVGPKLSLAFLIFGSISAMLAAVFAYEYLPDILRAFGRDPTLTGRTLIWPVLIGSVLKHPLLGYGFYSFWQGLEGESGNVINATNWSFGYAHNGFLEIALQLGILGVVLFVATLIQAVKNAWICFRYDPSGTYDWYIGLIVLTIAYNLDEATVLFPNDLLSILYVVACCGLALAAKQLKAQSLLNGGLRI